MSAPAVVATKVQQDLWDEINAEMKFNIELLQRGTTIRAGDVAVSVHRAMRDVAQRHGLEYK